jgi:hypothetical protein
MANKEQTLKTPGHVEFLNRKARRLARQFDRQLRANNPECFEANGCRKPGAQPAAVSIGMRETITTMERTLAELWDPRNAPDPNCGAVSLDRNDARRLIVLLDGLNEYLESAIKSACAPGSTVAFDPNDAAQLKRDRHFWRVSQNMMIRISTTQDGK